MRVLLADVRRLRQVLGLPTIGGYSPKIIQFIAGTVLLVNDPLAVRGPNRSLPHIIRLRELVWPSPRGAHFSGAHRPQEMTTHRPISRWMRIATSSHCRNTRRPHPEISPCRIRQAEIEFSTVRATTVLQSFTRHHSSFHGNRDICRDGPSGWTTKPSEKFEPIPCSGSYSPGSTEKFIPGSSIVVSPSARYGG